MTALFKLSRRSLDELEEELVAHAQRINAAEYAFLELVREFDIRQGWKPYQFNNCDPETERPGKSGAVSDLQP